MKKSLFLLLAVVALFGLAVSCGGGGDDDEDYIFAGRWAATLIVTQSNLPGFPVGYQGPDVLVINQNGNQILATWESVANELTMTGTCDPKAGNFAAAGVTTVDAIYMDVSGSGMDDDTMSGVWSMQRAGIVVMGTWTGNLASRVAGSVPGGMVADLTGKFSR